MPDLLLFPPSLRRPEAKEEVINWIADWPFPLEAKKSGLRLWAETYNVQLSQADWARATGEGT